MQWYELDNLLDLLHIAREPSRSVRVFRDFFREYAGIVIVIVIVIEKYLRLYACIVFIVSD